MNLKEMENKALSNVDISNLLHGCVNIVVYPDVYKYKSIDQLMGVYGACALLYEAKPNYGHWCAVIKIGNDCCEFFDPYGGNIDGIPDEVLQHIDPTFRDETHQNHTYLAKLMYDSRYDLSYNQYKFQEHKEGIKTCGRHVVSRIMFKNLSLDDYKRYLDKLSKYHNLNYDGIVTYLTKTA